MITYPKTLRSKDLKKISRYPCDEEIKDAYLKYLTYYSFTEFVAFHQENDGKNLDEIIFEFTDLQLEKFKPNSIVWVSHVLVNFLIYANVNLDYGQYYDAYASIIQFTVLDCAMLMSVKKIPFDEVSFPEQSAIHFEKLFNAHPDFRFNLKTDCNLAYKSFNTGFDFTSEEFYSKVEGHFMEKGY